MPCRSDYPEPNAQDRYRQNTANMYRFLLGKLKLPIPKHIHDAAQDVYCQADYTTKVCESLKGLSKKTFDEIVYNARDPLSRRLADWWEHHQEKDSERARCEEAEKTAAQHRKSALAKLTPAERKALGLKS